jgi:hypothetical protein
MAASRWSWSRLRDRQRDAAGPDLADMGTAFALDASLDWEPEAVGRPAEDRPQDAVGPARGAETTSAAPAVRWWQRRGARARG